MKFSQTREEAMRSREGRSNSESNNGKSMNETYRDDQERNKFILTERNRIVNVIKTYFVRGKKQFKNLGTKKLNKKLKSKYEII